MNKLKEWIKQNQYKIVICILLVIGFAVRIINIQNVPNGLNVDEASSGYEAYSIANYGIDRNGNSIPVFLLSWGSGQNALYTYMIIPFVKLLGLTVFSIRLPMAILGCMSLVVMYKLLLILKNKRLALIGLAFFAICPWHIMKSRWGLESNIFPDLLLISIYMLIYGLKNKKDYIFYLSFVVLGLCAYAYGTSYFFLPLFVVPVLIYLIIKKEIGFKKAIICLGIVFIVSFPIILYVIINTFDLPQLKILCFTIPRMTTNRYEELSSIFSSKFISTSFNNFIQSLNILILQKDNLGWNSISPYGITYIFSLPFTLIGIIKSFKINRDNKEIYKNIINIWFIASLLLLFVIEPNINRINIIMIPIIYYTIVGIFEVCNNNTITILIIIVYLISFILFTREYINTDFDKYMVFVDGVEDTIVIKNHIFIIYFIIRLIHMIILTQ